MAVFHPKNDYIGATDSTDGYVEGGSAGGAGPSSLANGIPFGAGGVIRSATVTADVPPTSSAVLTTLFSFTGADGQRPQSALIADAAGDLFGTTATGGADGNGTVYEIVKTAAGYANAPTVLVSFTGADGAYLQGSLTIDAAGDLFGTTNEGGGASNAGTVFEIQKTGAGYASAPTTLVTFTGADGQNPEGSLTVDAAGNLLGTTFSGGANGDGTVFEIAKTGSGYAAMPTTLVSFTGADGKNPQAALITDAAGDIFGTTALGGADGDGTVFEIKKTRSGYASAPTILVSFTGGGAGSFPQSSLVADAAGDLFGMTQNGGQGAVGTVFEIKKTQHGYASAPTILVSFTGKNGKYPEGSLIIDAAGNLFGETITGGTHEGGVVFEIAKTGSGYAKAPTVLVNNFSLSLGAAPSGGLMADAAGNLFGTTQVGGSQNDGTVFEITGSGFAPPAAPVANAADVVHASPPALAFAHAMAGFEPGRSATISPALLPSRHEVASVLARPQIA